MTSIASLIELIYFLFIAIVFAHVVLTWTQMSPYHPVRQTIDNFVRPMLAPIHKILPPAGGMDFSPMILMIVAYIAKTILLQILVSF